MLPDARVMLAGRTGVKYLALLSTVTFLLLDQAFTQYDISCIRINEPLNLRLLASWVLAFHSVVLSLKHTLVPSAGPYSTPPPSFCSPMAPP